MSRKFLIFAIMIFIIAIGAVSAQDINNDAVVSYENQNVSELSTLAVDDVETADILQSDSNSEISALGEDEGVESIVANDVVDGDSFSATFFDSQGNPLIDQEVGFTVSGKETSYFADFYPITDSEGVATINPALPKGNYEVWISNYNTGQYTTCWWNITKNDDSKFVEITVSRSGPKLIVGAIDSEGIDLTSGTFQFLSENSESCYAYLEGNSYVELNLYREFDLNNFPQNISIKFINYNYYPANSTVYVGKLADSIEADDVVDEFSFSATFLDDQGNPLNDASTYFYVHDMDYNYSKYFYPATDSNGVAVIDPALPVGNYSVTVENYYTWQSKTYWWNISKIDDSKYVDIVAFQEGGKLIVDAFDEEGNNVTEGIFKFTYEDGNTYYESLDGRPFVEFNLYYFDFNDYPQNITIDFTSDYFWPANSSIYVDELVDTIVADDVVDEFSFSATFLDGFGNPVSRGYSEFYIYNEDGSYRITLNPKTDSNGVIVVDPTLPVGNYTVQITNYKTYQSKKCWWNISKTDDSKFVDIVASQVGSILIVSAVDREGNNVTEGEFVFTLESDKVAYSYLDGKSFVEFSLLRNFELNDFPQNMTIRFTSSMYYPANSTIYIDDLIDTIVADDVVDEFSFSATFLDGFGNPLNNSDTYFGISCTDGSYSRNFQPLTDLNGVAIVKAPLHTGIYTVDIYNIVTGQDKIFNWIITKEDESKIAFINVTRDKYRFTINVFDNDGKKIDDGLIRVDIKEDYNSETVEVNNGTAIFDYVFTEGTSDGLKHLLFTLENDNYYPANTTSTLTFRNTIDVSDSLGTQFNATFLDMDGNPLKNQDIMFLLYDGDKSIENITVKTDENGFASIEKTDGYYQYKVITKNLATYQQCKNDWINKKVFEIVPVAYYDEESKTYILENETLIFKVSPDATGEVYVYDLRYNQWQVNISDGEITITLPYPDTYYLYAQYFGDKNYSARTVSLGKILFKEKLYPTMTISENLTGDYGEKVNFTVNLKYGSNVISNASVEIMVGNDTYNMTTDDAGNIALPLELDAGKYDVSVSYAGSSDYSSVNKTTTLTINKIDPTIDVNKTIIDYGEKLIVNVDDDAEGEITAVINGKNYTASVANGTATIDLEGLDTGNYTASISYSGDNNYNALTKEFNITVEADKSDIISAPDVTKYYGGAERFVVTVTDYQTNPLANKSVTVVINGVSYTRKTNANGTTNFPLGINSGIYNVTVTVDNKTINSVVTILSTVNGTDIVKMYRNGTQYWATFLDSEGKYLANGTAVLFNINGVLYERKISGDKGLAKLNINLAQGNYIITASNPVTGDNTANNITVLPLLTENNDITKYYRNGTQYTVKVLGDDGNPVGAGETVTFNINGVFYTRQTDANGTAKLNINLQPGDYIITAQYNGSMVSNNIKVLPVLNATDVTMTYRDGTQFEANLVDGQGRPYANQKVEFNINGVFYYRTTDSSGIAKLNINLMPGEYIITSSYNGSSIANTIKINA